jgi:hypothetical protein
MREPQPGTSCPSLDTVKLAPALTGRLQADVMFSVGPIDADEGLELLIQQRCHVNLHK